MTEVKLKGLTMWAGLDQGHIELEPLLGCMFSNQDPHNHPAAGSLKYYTSGVVGIGITMVKDSRVILICPLEFGLE